MNRGQTPVVETNQSSVYGLRAPRSALSSEYIPAYGMSTESESSADAEAFVVSDGEMDLASADEMQLDTARIVGEGVPVDRAEFQQSLNRSLNRRVDDMAPSPNQYRSYGPKPDEDFWQEEVDSSRMRTRMSEEEHAALAVLNDEELLVTYALNSGRSIPQTRRRFQAKLLSGGDPQLEEELYAERFVIPASKSHHVSGLHVNSKASRPPESAMGLNNSTAFLIRGTLREIVDHDESGWWAPDQKKRTDHNGGMKRHLKHGGISLRSNPSGGNSRTGSRSASVTR